MKSTISNEGRKRVAAVICCTFFIFLNGIACSAAVKDMTLDLPDDYLAREFPWALVVDLPDANEYLKYPGSKLWPMTKVRVNLRTYPSGKNSSNCETTFYEEFWYHYHLPAGMKRFNEIAIEAQSNGAIIVCPGAVTVNALLRPLAITDAIVRLVVDIAQRHAATALVLVPEEDYECVVEGMSQFNFVPLSPGTAIRSLGIHLRSYPEGPEQRFYLQKR